MTGAAFTPEARRAAVEAGEMDLAGASRRHAFRSQLKAVRSSEADGKEFVTFDGYASVTDIGYTMWDYWGEYTETVAGGAFDVTLAANPDVAFLLNHTGMTMARTTSGTLELSADTTGLRYIAKCNAKRTDVANLALAIDDGDVDESSFAFRIKAGSWSPDYLAYTITEVDIDRGDVSAVNYGANPNTSISARAQQGFEAIEHLSGAPLVALRDRADALLAKRSATAPDLSARSDEIMAGPDKATLLALLSLED